MQPKLVDFSIKVFAFAFTPYSKWHIVIKLCHMIVRFLFHEVGRNTHTVVDALLEATQQELFTTEMAGFVIVVLMHICYGEQMRKAMRKSRILPMTDDSKWIRWIRRIALLTRH